MSSKIFFSLNCFLSLLIFYVKQLIISVKSSARQINILRRRELLAKIDEVLADGVDATVQPKVSRKTILVDADWDNLSFWFKVRIFKFCFDAGSVFKFALGPFNQRIIRETVFDLGVPEVFVYSYWRVFEIFFECLRYSFNVNGSKSRILKHNFFGIPGYLIYDEILRFQRRETVKFNSSLVVAIFRVRLWQIKLETLDINQFECALLSHVHTPFGLAATELFTRHRKSCFYLSSVYGSLRFHCLKGFEDYYEVVGILDDRFINSLGPGYLSIAKSRGERYFRERFGGGAKDVGARFAYGDLSQSRCDIRIPDTSNFEAVVGIYSSKWFDTPHAYGMENFEDFNDWLRFTIKTCSEVPTVCWIIRPHPCDRWYGGTSLQAVTDSIRMPSNVKILDEGVSAVSFMDICDAAVTPHGTCGIEFCAKGKLALVADRNWYSCAGLGIFCGSRAEYARNLREIVRLIEEGRSSADDLRSKAFVFGGLFYTGVTPKHNLMFPDDFAQELAIDALASLLSEQKEQLAHEVRIMRDWYSQLPAEKSLFRKRILSDSAVFNLRKLAGAQNGSK